MAKRRPTTLLLTCEHGGHGIPRSYRSLFRGADQVLASHRGWDPGALRLALRLAKALHAPLFAATVTRLLVELNRSPHHPRLFSEFTRQLPKADRDVLLNKFYWPHREAVEAFIRERVAAGERVLHVGVHSFTPVMSGVTRNADIGLLYDPSRAWERQFCDAWRQALGRQAPDLRVRKNYPYLGTADGFTTYLRTRFGNTLYAGIELEVNQRYPLGSASDWRGLQEVLQSSLQEALR